MVVAGPRTQEQGEHRAPDRERSDLESALRRPVPAQPHSQLPFDQWQTKHGAAAVKLDGPGTVKD